MYMVSSKQEKSQYWHQCPAIKFTNYDTYTDIMSNFIFQETGTYGLYHILNVILQITIIQYSYTSISQMANAWICYWNTHCWNYLNMQQMVLHSSIRQYNVSLLEEKCTCILTWTWKGLQYNAMMTNMEIQGVWEAEGVGLSCIPPNVTP